NADRALRYCDLFNVPSQEEKRTLEERSVRAQTIVLPYGLNEKERAAFASAARPTADRLVRKEICFLGMWGLRKGSRDWRDIISGVLKSLPDARFAFFGTMTDDQTVLQDLNLPRSESIRCLTSYDPAELPK